SGPASFFVSVTQARIPVPSPPKLLLKSRKQSGKQENDKHPIPKPTQSILFNPEKEQENKKTAWFIRLRWDC
ncbi:MAG: hypothetical protein ACLTFJ_13815, partial [Clostridium sp.]